MTTPQLYEIPGEPERGYFTAEDVERCGACRGTGEVMIVPIGGAPWDDHPLVGCGRCDETGYVLADTLEPVRPATCSICQGAIEPESTVPLCPRHQRLGRAHGRLDAERTRQEATR